MKLYRHVATFVFVLGLVALGPAVAEETSAAAEQTPAVAAETATVGTQAAETTAVEQESTELSTAPEACTAEAGPSPLQLEAYSLSLGLECGECTTCSSQGERCRCGTPDPFPDCRGTCQQLGPALRCIGPCLQC